MTSTDMKTKPDNPPAFPLFHKIGIDDWEKGMTLRDYFAAHALTGITSELSRLPKEGGGRPKTLNATRFAVCAYQFADAMLKAREGVW